MAEPTPTAPRTIRTLQAHLVLTGVLVTGSFAAVIGISLFVPIAAQLGRAQVQSPEAFGLAEHFLFLHAAFWPVILVSLIASIVSATVLYRRMREPLVRFVHSYEMLRSGRSPGPVRIRTTDYLAEEAEALNALIRSLERERSGRSRAAERLREAVDHLAVTPGVPDDVLTALSSIAKELEGFGTEDPDGPDLV